MSLCIMLNNPKTLQRIYALTHLLIYASTHLHIDPITQLQNDPLDQTD
jgi:hypothetical protein